MKVTLFVTCLADRILPDVGNATVALLERLGVEAAPVFGPALPTRKEPFARRSGDTIDPTDRLSRAARLLMSRDDRELPTDPARC